MIRHDRTVKVLKDTLDKESGLITVAVRAKDLQKYIGQDLPIFVMIDTERAHNPKELSKLVVTKEAEGVYAVNDHKLIFRPRYTCTCEFYQFSNGLIPCKHLLAVLKEIIAAKKF